MLNGLFDFFSDFPDPRCVGRTRHRFLDTFIIAVVDGKFNEITAIPAGNQKKRHQAVTDYCQSNCLAPGSSLKPDYDAFDEQHGRLVRRRGWVCSVSADVTFREDGSRIRRKIAGWSNNYMASLLFGNQTPSVGAARRRHLMRKPCIFGLLLTGLLVPLRLCANEMVVKQPLDAPAVRGTIIAAMLKKHDNPFLLHPYDPNYIIYTNTTHINKAAAGIYGQSKNFATDEAKFQLSLSFPVWRAIVSDNSLLGASYTQQSWWQITNTAESSPFRETNYQPQFFLAWLTDYSFAGWVVREIELGLNHQSNGRAEPASRSWNRAYARLMAQRGNWQVDLKPWVRFTEQADKDDNPDIIKYMGHYRLKAGYAWGDSVLSLECRYNWNSGYGAAEIGWSYPVTRHVRFYAQLFSGYGESLIDYNFRQTRAGLGIMLNDIL